MKLLSICVPSYNSEGYLAGCIDSLLVGGEEVEIIIVDDGSKDHTAEIADRYQSLHPNIVRVIHKENGGHGSAVNAGIQNATGMFFKVVDSDDHLKESAFKKVLEKLRELAGATPQLDMLLCNFVYDKEGEKRHKVMQYRSSLPVDQMFTWDQVGHFRKGHYILMHSVIFRTKLLRECGLELPEHTFYVDNIYVFNPLPYVQNMYYMDINLYYYYIGRVDQSVNQQVMISRIDQQLRVNKLMIDYYTSKEMQPKINAHKPCRNYMYNYLEIITTVSSVLAIVSNTPENLAKKDELWQYLKSKNYSLYLRMRHGALGTAMHLPGRGGRAVTVEGYKIAQKLFNFY